MWKKYAILNKYYDFQKFDSVNLDKIQKAGSSSWSAVRKFDKSDTLTTHSTDLWYYPTFFLNNEINKTFKFKNVNYKISF